MDIRQPDVGSTVDYQQENYETPSLSSAFLPPENAQGSSTIDALLWGCRTFPARIVEVIEEHRLFLAILVGYIVCGLFLANQVVDLGTQTFILKIYHSVYFPMLLCMLALFVGWRGLCFAAQGNPGRLFPSLWKDLRRDHITGKRISHGLIPLLSFPFFLATYTIFKSQIPTVQPFSWDVTLSQWDYRLHAERYPWEWLNPVLAHQWVTLAVNIIYNVWLFVSYLVLFWQIFSLKNRETRRRFLLSFLTLWIILGSAGALFFSSAGPCYFDEVAQAANPYAPLMTFLYEVNQSLPLWALSSQEYLWNAYANDQISLGSGISAMPSMHVAAATLYALLGWRYNRLLGWGLTIYAILIMVGSVHLGWHYAVDGYVAAIATILIWHLFGWYGKRHPLPRSSS